MGTGTGHRRRAARSSTSIGYGFLGPAARGARRADDDADLARLAARGATIVTCPRSNSGPAPAAADRARFYASGARVAIGTDSLASAPT